jgi:hypothetical protein
MNRGNKANALRMNTKDTACVSLGRLLVRAYQPQKRQRGQSMIEAAFVLTMIVAVLFLGFHLVPVFLHLEAVVDAARQGANAAAEQGSLNQGCAAGITYSKQKLTDAGILKGARIAISVTPANPAHANLPYQGGNTITVSVQASIPLIWGSSQQFQSSASEEIQPGRSHWPVPPGVSINGLCNFSG